KFYYWLETSLRYCSRYYANSESTARDLKQFMAEVGQERPIEVVPLAQRFSDLSASPGQSSTTSLKGHLDEIRDIDRSVLNLTKMPYVLVVGTMETRKNAWRLAQAWQRLSQDRDINVPKLVFAGKSGWHNGDFDTLMTATGNLGGWVQMVNGPSDSDLQFLYKNCLFTAMVSYYEGWGLPIGEGLSFGKTGVVADNSSMPEVGGDMVEYCDAHSIDSIYSVCRRLIEDVDHRVTLETRIANTRLRTWDDVAADVVRLVHL
ncbi:MAG: glycosyltransferase, partial [Paracoccaceae bacterium]|nr:glycosyltransferase [Paracoccaceae bacterium]